MTDATPADDAATGTTLKEKAKAATKAAALAAEKTKISKVSLPSAYAALGKACYKKKQWEEDFPEIYQELRDLSAKQKEAKEKAAQEPEAKGFADKAKSIAKQGVQLAKNQQLNLQISLALAKLGQAAFEKHGKESGPEEHVSAIQSLTARLADLDGEIGGQVTKAGGKKKLMWVAGALCVFLFIGIMKPADEPTSDTSSTNEDAQADTSTPTARKSKTLAPDDIEKHIPKNPKLHAGYKDGWEEGVAAADNFLAQIEERAENEDIQEAIKNDRGWRMSFQRYKNGLQESNNSASQLLLRKTDQEISSGTLLSDEEWEQIHYRLGFAEGELEGFSNSIPYKTFY